MKHRTITDALANDGLSLRIGPFIARVQTRIPDIEKGIRLFYGDYVLADVPFADFHVTLRQPSGLRRWWRPQVLFEFDGWSPFKPLPYSQALAVFEWGLNWCVAAHAHEYLVIHAAVLARQGRALILPGAGGVGKSTLCACLAHAGWRLLSDELTLLSLDGELVFPLARPISLKNQSVTLLKKRLPGGVFSHPMHDTTKGTVTLLKAPDDSVAGVERPASPAWVVFPRYEADALAQIETVLKADAFLTLGEQSMNYSIHGKRGFNTLSSLLDKVSCHRLTYGDVDEAMALLDTITGTTPTFD